MTSLHAQFDDAGPVRLVLDWVEQVLDDDTFADGWGMFSWAMQRKLVADWAVSLQSDPFLSACFDAATVSQEAVAGPSESWAWQTFAATQQSLFRQAWPHRFRGWAASSKVRVLAPDVEQVCLVDSQGRTRVEQDTLMRAVLIRVRFDLTAGWRVDGFGN